MLVEYCVETGHKVSASLSRSNIVKRVKSQWFFEDFDDNTEIRQTMFNHNSKN